VPLSDEPQDWVVVIIGGQPFAFAAHQVSGILQMMEPIPVPSWPDCALGMIDVHGDLMPLIDPALGLGQAPAELSSRHFIIIIAVLQKRWGMVVNLVEGVRNARVRSTSLGKAGVDKAAAHQPFAGILVGEGVPVVALDPEALVRVLKIEDLDTSPESR